MDKSIKEYYRRGYQGGRGKFARVLDVVLLHAVFMAACYIWFYYHMGRLWPALLLTGLTSLLLFLAAHLWRSIRFERFVARERARLADIVQKERLLLLNEKSFQEICRHAALSLNETDTGRLFCVRRAAKLNEDDVLTAFYAAQKEKAAALVICSVAAPDERAGALLKRLPARVTLIGKEALLRAARGIDGYAVNDADIEAYIHSEIAAKKERREKLPAQPFVPGNAKKYLLCGLFLTAASFLSGYTLYFRLLAGVCLLLSAATFALNRPFAPNPAKETE
ncbi:MAG: hypothetical protein LBS18_04425 [Clostridiales bacterium]|jgi:hypothetical protein|nr:hypothetical protein [Clostridiales bacterium]